MAILFAAVLFLALSASINAQVRAGDPAPAIDWARLVRSPAAAKYSPTLSGQYTVLRFIPVTPNAQAVARWNELIAKFADQPVQFVWIAAEPSSAIEPFLRDHPLGGWLLTDEKRAMAGAYGANLGEDVIVDPSGRIAGFTSIVESRQLTAVLAGKAVAMPLDTPDEQVFKLLAGGKVRLESEPRHLDLLRANKKPAIAPSYEVHITPSTTKSTEASAGPDFWVQRGFDLQTVVAMVYETEPSRVFLPQSFANSQKFDFVVVLPREEDPKTIYQLVQRAIEKRFNLSAAVESKPVDVYVMTAIKGKTPPAKTGPETLGGGSISSGSLDFSLPDGTPPTQEAIDQAIKELRKHPEAAGFSAVSAHNMSAGEFAGFLERDLARPIIDETGLEGVYDFEVHGVAQNRADLVQMLRDQTGLVLTPETRSIELVTLRSL